MQFFCHICREILLETQGQKCTKNGENCGPSPEAETLCRGLREAQASLPQRPPEPPRSRATHSHPERPASTWREGHPEPPRAIQSHSEAPRATRSRTSAQLICASVHLCICAPVRRHWQFQIEGPKKRRGPDSLKNRYRSG